ncbi:uncharacterized protein A4U43_C01F21170 [Asparagus officinalis]|uniref:Uncharacterized protein n=1 Tax=Asparagus officinalis TaxID=4686 RepID=A0A5P1FR91_ASPOF|nr:uncharacterized protein A4U43_C01F21170 [Asparagus officinalis]
MGSEIDHVDWFSESDGVLRFGVLVRREFSNQIPSAVAEVQALTAADSSYGKADLTLLFKMAAYEAKKSQQQGRIFRVRVYDRLVDALEHVTQHEGYILESGQGLSRVVIRHLSMLLCHPDQRCIQDDLDIPKSLMRRTVVQAESVDRLYSSWTGPLRSSKEWKDISSVELLFLLTLSVLGLLVEGISPLGIMINDSLNFSLAFLCDDEDTNVKGDFDENGAWNFDDVEPLLGHESI